MNFNGADLQRIRVPGVDLSGGHIDSCQLQGADLEGANLTATWLRQADFSEAKVEGVVFGEKPSLKVREVLSSAISPDGTKLAQGFESGHVHVHDTSNWDRLNTLTGHTLAVRYLAFSCSGLLLASAGWESVIVIWFLSGREYNLLQGNSGPVRGISFSLDGNLLVSAFNDGSIWIWDAHSATAVSQLNGQHPSLFHLPVCWSSDGEHIATVESSFITSDIMLWQAKTGECERVLANGILHVHDIAYSPVGQLWSQLADMTYICGTSRAVVEMHESCKGTPVLSTAWLSLNMASGSCHRALIDRSGCG